MNFDSVIAKLDYPFAELSPTVSSDRLKTCRACCLRPLGKRKTDNLDRFLHFAGMSRLSVFAHCICDSLFGKIMISTRFFASPAAVRMAFFYGGNGWETTCSEFL